MFVFELFFFFFFLNSTSSSSSTQWFKFYFSTTFVCAWKCSRLLFRPVKKRKIIKIMFWNFEIVPSNEKFHSTMNLSMKMVFNQKRYFVSDFLSFVYLRYSCFAYVGVVVQFCLLRDLDYFFLNPWNPHNKLLIDIK